MVRQLASRWGDLMPEATSGRGPGEREHLSACLHSVDVARAHLGVARHESTRGCESQALRTALLDAGADALEAYAAVITQFGAPVPRRLRNEIELYRGLRNRS